MVLKMKSLAVSCLLIFVAVTALAQAPAAAASSTTAGTLTQQERDAAVAQFERTKGLFLESVKGLTLEQWNFKSAPDRWSVAEVAEHITLSEEAIAQLVTERIMKMPAATAEQKEKARGKEQVVLTKVVDRSVKAQAPEFLKPTGRFKTQQELVSEFEKRRTANISYIQNTQDALHDHVFDHPVAGPLDAYEWMLLVSAHSERHTAQINEVKADPKFPK
jgi:DinB superfamily